MEENGQLHSPAALRGGRASSTNWIQSMVNPRVGLVAVEKRKILHCREPNYDLQPIAYRYTDRAIPTFHIVACFASSGWMTFRKRDCNNSRTLRVLPPLPPLRYGRATYRDVLDDVTCFLACRTIAAILE
jgi:hypothetical protein